jgi:Icc-related predicted phosphoesterase
VKIWHLSDTHGFHDAIKQVEDVDIIIHSGDCSNHIDPYQNEQEVRSFIECYRNLKARYKIYVAGNHDTSIEKRLVTKLDFQKAGIIYLENESCEIGGLNIWGSPITPRFGNWAFMRDRAKTNKLWQSIPDNTDIVITHGPPKGILDLSYNRKHELEHCGDSALTKRIFNIKPQLVCFGHIHNNEDNYNHSVLTLDNTIYSNAACVIDGKFDLGLVYNGIIIYL